MHPVGDTHRDAVRRDGEERTPIVLSVAGSDPSGGAGIQADLKTFSALCAYGGAVVAGLTAQSTRGVSAVHPVPASFVTAQLDAVCGDSDVRAIKTGMLGSPEVVAAVAEAVERHQVPALVVDPVMVAASGHRLVPAETVDAIRELLLPLATVITPNLPETDALLGRPDAGERDLAERGAAGRALRELGAAAVLVKGGHGGGDRSVDVLVDAAGEYQLDAPRIRTDNTHGTGCTLAAAIAVGLAEGMPLRAATRRAKDYLTAAITAADSLAIGAGHGPVHHFHRWWEPAPPARREAGRR